MTNDFKMRTICNVEFVVCGCGGLCLGQEEHTALVIRLRAFDMMNKHQIIADIM